jgi:integrase
MVKLRGSVYYAILYVPDETGKKKNKWIKLEGCKSEKAAKTEEARLKAELSKPHAVIANKQTLKDYLEQWLLASRPRLQNKTYETYEVMIRIYLIPELGYITLAKLTPDHIEGAYARLINRPRLRRNSAERQTLSATTVVNCHRILNAALNRAVKHRRLGWNPASVVHPPKLDKNEIHPWGVEEIVSLMNTARTDGSPYYIPIFLALTTGLRRGEILALRWADLDLEKRMLTVDQAIEQTKEHGIQFKDPKNKPSRRTIMIPSVLVEALKEYRLVQKQRMLKKNIVQTDYCYLCCWSTGEPLSPAAFSVGFGRYLQRLGLPRMRFHDLRHSHASILIALEVPTKAISSRLGHGGSKITMDVYGHLLKGVEEGLVDKLDRQIRGVMGEDKHSQQETG